MSTHLIKQGDTLSELAVQYGTDVATLQKCNAQQIKDIDLLYDGETLTLPDELDISCGELEPREPIASEALAQSQCAPTEPFVDALYVPEHPQSKKQKLILLTQKAKDSVIEDADKCNDAVGGDKDEVLTKLNALGVLDPFVSVGHDAFLRMNNPRLADAYKDALASHANLKLAYSNNEVKIPEYTPLSFYSGKRFKSIERAYLVTLSTLKKVKLNYDNNISNFDKSDYKTMMVMHVNSLVSKEEFIEFHYKLYMKSTRHYQEILLDQLNSMINYFEDAAQYIAKKIKVEDEKGGYFQYSNENEYYSSNKQLEIDEALKNLIDSRPKTQMDDSLDAHDLTSSNDIMDLQKAYTAYSHWKGTGDAALRASNNSPLYTRSYLLNVHPHEKGNNKVIDHLNFYVAVHRLNQSSIVVKEQCLTESELFSGKEVVIALKGWLEEPRSIKEILHKVRGVLSGVGNWGYYSAYVAGLLIANVVMTRIRDFSKLIGDNANYNEYVQQIVVFIEKSKLRCDDLKEIAEKNKDHPVLEYRKSEISWFGDIPTTVTSPYTLIWEEKSWVPEKLDGQIYVNNPNARTIVECSLSSAPDKALYIISDNPALSSEKAKNCGQVKAIELGTGTAQITSKNELKKGLIGADSEFETSATLFKFSEEIKDSNFEEIVFPWRVRDIEIFGLKGRSEASAGAQFFRYLNSADGKLLLASPLGKKAKASGRVRVQKDFTLASAQAKVEISYPENGFEPLTIPYYLKGNKKKQKKGVGGVQVVITAQVHGFLAATLQLSSEVYLGNASNGSLGIVGRKTVTTDTTVGLGVENSAKVFAGVEVGGSVDCAFNWYPERETKAINLFKVGGGASASFGVGAGALLQCAYHKGKFILRCELSGTIGAGFKGKVIVELNPFAMDKFFGVLFEITKISGFSRFGFFDDEGRLSAFGILNDMITIAITFGLTLAQVALLPFALFEELSRQASDKRNAFFIANFILQKATKISWLAKSGRLKCHQKPCVGC